MSDNDNNVNKYISNPGFKVEGGTVFETPTNDASYSSSGDGTCPLDSLMYATKHWDAVLHQFVKAVSLSSFFPSVCSFFKTAFSFHNRSTERC